MRLLIAILFLIVTKPVFSQCPLVVTAECAGVPMSGIIVSASQLENIDFTFDSFSKIIGGIGMSGKTQLRVQVQANTALCKWGLYMTIDNIGAVGATDWSSNVIYGTSGNPPGLDLLKVEIYNGCNTPINNRVYQEFVTNAQMIPIIEDLGAINVAGSCVTNVNGPGNYITNYNEFSFTVDYRIIPSPSLNITPGQYSVKVHFCLVEN